MVCNTYLALHPSFCYSWIDLGLQCGLTPEFSLSMSGFKSVTSFGSLKITGVVFWFFVKSQNKLIWLCIVFWYFPGGCVNFSIIEIDMFFYHNELSYACYVCKTTYVVRAYEFLTFFETMLFCCRTVYFAWTWFSCKHLILTIIEHKHTSLTSHKYSICHQTKICTSERSDTLVLELSMRRIHWCRDACFCVGMLHTYIFQN